MKMKIVVNGEQRECIEGVSIQVLLNDLEIEKERVAVELNSNIIPRIELEGVVLKDGDILEIVTFVGGG